MSTAVPVNAHKTGLNSTVPIRHVATATAIATQGPARMAAIVMPIESRKIGSLVATTIQPITRLSPTSVGMRTIFAGFTKEGGRARGREGGGKLPVATVSVKQSLIVLPGPLALLSSRPLALSPLSLIENVSDTARWVAVYRAMETARPDAHFRDPYAARLAGAQGEAIVDSMERGRQMAWAMIVRTASIDSLIVDAVRNKKVDL